MSIVLTLFMPLVQTWAIIIPPLISGHLQLQKNVVIKGIFSKSIFKLETCMEYRIPNSLLVSILFFRHLIYLLGFWFMYCCTLIDIYWLQFLSKLEFICIVDVVSKLEFVCIVDVVDLFLNYYIARSFCAQVFQSQQLILLNLPALAST